MGVPQNPFRLVHFHDQDDFLNATRPYDDGYMNYIVGTVLDNADQSPAGVNARERWGGGPQAFLGVYRGDELVLTTAKLAINFSWLIAAPRGTKQPLQSSEVHTAVLLMVSYLPSVIDTTTVDQLLGEEVLVNAFLGCWVDHMTGLGSSVKLLDTMARTRVAYATLATIPEPNPALAHHRMVRPTLSDAEEIAQLYVQFGGTSPVAGTLERGRGIMAGAIQSRRLWICKDGDIIVGFILIARMTPRTVSIKQVFVSPSHRRRGIAEAMVRTLSRFFLGAHPSGLEGSDGTDYEPEGGIRDAVCLNVGEEEAARVYVKAGFLLGAKDPVTGRDGWYPSSWRGVEYLDALSQV
ncbi:hypothetical protein EIP91_000842 [Steccherinum ochraceum]|uniref:N-acetyltransferase domain-containing protein n=1 Tax=Steccherinum ochraceum TaxID=92696 RepID=A0A4R0RSS8_9APHY|nr:hypothetical protein EIP91_000842 [Steccherinum ochraceum]